MKTLLISIVLTPLLILLVYAEDSSGNTNRVVAAVLDTKITAGDIGLEYDANNNPIILINAPSTCSLRQPLDELCLQVRRLVMRDYIKQNNLTATDEEILEIQEAIDQHTEKDKIRRTKKLKELEIELQDISLSEKKRAKLKKRQKTLLKLKLSDEKHEEDKKEYALTKEHFRKIYAPFVEGAKYSKMIYEKYGGVVQTTKFGPSPVGATAQLLKEYEKQNKIVIHNDTIKNHFWRRLNKPPRYTTPSDKVDFTPFWRKPYPEEE